MNLRNPLVWLRRLRHRRGYGVHSPWAFDMRTQVIYNPGRYYDYELIDALYPPWLRRRQAITRLLFRLANRWEGGYLIYIRARVEDLPPLTEDTLLVVDRLQRNGQLWRTILDDPRTRVTFDLHDVGIAVFMPSLQRQDYTINW